MIGRDNGLREQFPQRATSASHKAKTEGKAEKPTIVDISTINAETLGALSLAQLGTLFEAVQSAMQEKMLGAKTPSEKPKPAARKQATA